MPKSESTRKLRSRLRWPQVARSLQGLRWPSLAKFDSGVRINLVKIDDHVISKGIAKGKDDRVLNFPGFFGDFIDINISQD